MCFSCNTDLTFELLGQEVHEFWDMPGRVRVRVKVRVRVGVRVGQEIHHFCDCLALFLVIPLEV